MTEAPSRRPIQSRETGWAKALSKRLVDRHIAPNQISQGAIICAAVAGLAFVIAGYSDGALRTFFLVLAATGCGLRLICNMLDGMVAIEGGQSAPDGPFWNEAPDRIADIMIFVGIGYGAGLPAFGWAAAAMAILTAYVRELGRAEGTGNDFSGPLAKPQRMAVVCGAAILAIIEGWLTGTFHIMVIALIVITIGSAATATLRAANLIEKLNQKAKDDTSDTREFPVIDQVLSE